MCIAGSKGSVEPLTRISKAGTGTSGPCAGIAPAYTSTFLRDGQDAPDLLAARGVLPVRLGDEAPLRRVAVHAGGDAGKRVPALDDVGGHLGVGVFQVLSGVKELHEADVQGRAQRLPRAAEECEALRERPDDAGEGEVGIFDLPPP